MSKSQRDKGAAFERWVANEIKERTGLPARRGLGQARSAHEVADVDGVPGWWIECKVGKSPPTTGALEQADEARDRSGHYAMTVAVVKRDRHEPMAYLRLWDLLTLTGDRRPVSMHNHEIVCMRFQAWLDLLAASLHVDKHAHTTIPKDADRMVST